MSNGLLGVDYIKFKKLSKRAGKSIKTLADEIGVAAPTVYNVLKSENPPATTVNKIAIALGTSFNELLTEDQLRWKRNIDTLVG